ncbi:MAG: DUF433 domain-containing protein [Parvularculaceae bacterium]
MATTEIYPGITIDPDICAGKPTVRGLRVRVSDILELLASDVSREDILKDYPYLAEEDISAALKYAARTTDMPIIMAAE